MYISDKRPQTTKCYFNELKGSGYRYFILAGTLYFVINHEEGFVYNFTKEITDYVQLDEVIQPVLVGITIEKDLVIER